MGADHGRLQQAAWELADALVVQGPPGVAVGILSTGGLLRLRRPAPTTYRGTHA